MLQKSSKEINCYTMYLGYSTVLTKHSKKKLAIYSFMIQEIIKHFRCVPLVVATSRENMKMYILQAKIDF